MTISDPNTPDLEDDGLAQAGPDDTAETGLDDGIDPDSLLDDDEPEGGDGGDEPGEDEDHGGVDEGRQGRAAQVKPASRATQRVQSALREAKAAKAEAEASRREVAELRALQQGRQTETQAALERERIALMSPDEKLDFYRQKDRQELDQRFAQMQFQQADTSDRARFDSLCARQSQDGKLYSEIAGEVEAQLAEARRAGINLPRTTIAERILGQRFLSRAARAKPKQQRASAERVARETARAPGGQSNVVRGTARGSDAAARTKRLENLEI